MTVVGEDRRARARPESGEIEQIKRLIEIQTQIVELAKQNELTEKQCEALRQQLSQAARRPRRRLETLGAWFRRVMSLMRMKP